MNILVVGSGGREHALAWKIHTSPKIKKLFIAPGNPGTAKLGSNIPILVTNQAELVLFAKKNSIDLVVVGPDDAIAAGLVDALLNVGIKAFGPTKSAAEIESSKAFAKKLMTTSHIPTAAFQTFTEYKQAKQYLSKQKIPIVIKASGLALGKGAIVCKTRRHALQTLEEIMVKKIFGDAGREVVIEEFLGGQEISIHAFCDGKHAALFPTAQDHKPVFEKDQGPNTGGMGTIAPVSWVDTNILTYIENSVVIKTLSALRKKGREFKGCLYPGLMITNKEPKVLEFNARFGDPETQSYMRILKTDIVDIMLACLKGTLHKISIEWEKKFACCIVLASGGYPGTYKKGVLIRGVEKAEKLSDIVVFYAGTKIENSILVTNGGRVLGVSAVGNSLEEALQKAYNAVDKIHFDGMQYRKDIGKRSGIKI